MRVFYDHQAFSLQDYGGISRIFTELVKGLPARNAQAHLSLLFTKNIHLSEAGLSPRTPFNKLASSKRGIMYALNEWYNQVDIKRQRFDIYHPTYYGCSLLDKAKGKPIVATFHDAIHEKMGGRFSELKADQTLIDQKKQLLSRSARIIAVSENTKRDIIEIYNVPPEKVEVIYLGNSFSSQASNTASTARPYLLFVGNRSVYKNFIPFLTAVAPLLIKKGVALVCAGGKPFTENELNTVKSLKVESLVTQQDITDSGLSNLYVNAEAFIFPSLYEGFGIPVLEAFSCNCPCIVSNTSSLPEVAGDAALYFDPNDADSIYFTIEKLLGNDELRQEMIRKGQKRLTHFSWGKHIDSTLSLYNSLV